MFETGAIHAGRHVKILRLYNKWKLRLCGGCRECWVKLGSVGALTGTGQPLPSAHEHFSIRYFAPKVLWFLTYDIGIWSDSMPMSYFFPIALFVSCQAIPLKVYKRININMMKNLWGVDHSWGSSYICQPLSAEFWTEQNCSQIMPVVFAIQTIPPASWLEKGELSF